MAASRTTAVPVQNAPRRISFAKMRSHPIELAHLAVANIEWMGGRCDQYLFCRYRVSSSKQPNSLQTRAIALPPDDETRYI